MNYDHLLYTRGFFFSQEAIEPPVYTWVTKRIDTYYISFDSENQFAFSQLENKWVVILGLVLDISHWSLDINFIVSRCVELLSFSEEKMLNYIDHFSGRFLLIYHHNGTTKFMTDAFGTRSAFYSFQKTVMVASHCKIISDYRQAGESIKMALIKRDIKWKIGPNYGYPGNLTAYEGIYILTPNTLLNIEERRVQRFYPRRELQEGNLPDVVEEVSSLLKHQIELLQSNYNLAISLSAGIDSRVTFSAARNIAKDVLFFTYGAADYTSDIGSSLMVGPELASYINRMNERRRKSLSIDLMVASEMAEAFELSHVRLNRETSCQQEDLQSFNQVQNCNTYQAHDRKLAWEYLNKLPAGLLHIRSNLSGIAKAQYKKSLLSNSPPVTSDNMCYCWKRIMSKNEYVKDAFHHFDKITDFKSIFNYDPYNMFFWEHHEGTWLTCVLLESDVVFDTFELFNCRVLAEKVLSVPTEQRITSEIHYGIIKRLWPLLLHWPVNQMPFDKQLESVLAERDKIKALLKAEQLVSKENLAVSKKALAEREKLKEQLKVVKNSFSYRLGYILTQAVCKPGRNTLLLPYSLLSFLIQFFRSRILRKNESINVRIQ